MSPDNDLTPEEQRNFEEQLRIASREAEISENMTTFPGAPSRLRDEVLKNIMGFEKKAASQPRRTVGHYLEGFQFADAGKLTEAAADIAVDDLLKLLASKNIGIDRPHPQLVSAKEFYRWLSEDLVREQINGPIGEGWNVNFLYSELVPESPDAMNFMVATCLEDIFRVDGPNNSWTFEDNLIAKEEDDGPTELTSGLANYLADWRSAIRKVIGTRYSPVAGVRISEDLADFTFNIAYDVIRANGRRDSFEGAGTARLVFDGAYWSVRYLRFPGFEMPRARLS